MKEPQNVQIPYTLFTALLDALEYVDISNYADDFKTQFEGVLEALRDKKKRMDLRDDYSRLIAANKTDDENKRIDARIKYLKDKNKLL